MCIFLEDDPEWGMMNTDLIKRYLADNIGLASSSSPAEETFQGRLAAGASLGHIRPEEVEQIAERAAVEGLDEDELIEALCEERGVIYREREWRVTGEAEAEERAEAKAEAKEVRTSPPSFAGGYNVMHRHWSGTRLTSGLHRHGSGVALHSGGTFVSQVSPFKDERAEGWWTTGGGSSLTLRWKGKREVETRYKKFAGKNKFKGTHWLDGKRRPETEGANVLERV